LTTSDAVLHLGDTCLFLGTFPSVKIKQTERRHDEMKFLVIGIFISLWISASGAQSVLWQWSNPAPANWVSASWNGSVRIFELNFCQTVCLKSVRRSNAALKPPMMLKLSLPPTTLQFMSILRYPFVKLFPQGQQPRFKTNLLSYI
jgi:hypothetical protein